MLLSIVTPAFNEASNLPTLHQNLTKALESLDVDWEWIVIDDHSTDSTFSVIAELNVQDPRVRGVRLSRNFGSHSALFCGLAQAKGDAAVGMAADNQDPPSAIPDMVEEWREGYQVVWGERLKRHGEGALARMMSRLYNEMMWRFANVKNLPQGGGDFFLVDRSVIDVLAQCRETNTSILALLAWVGFRQTSVGYERQPRHHGKSGWTFGRKIKLVIDSMISFSYLPIRAMAVIGAVLAFLGLAYSPVIVVNRLFGTPAEGWTELMVIILLIGGFQMLMAAILGEYLWRVLEEVRSRPRYIIEKGLEEEPPDDAQSREDQRAVSGKP